LNVVVLASARSSVVQRLPEIQTVPDAAAVVDGKDNVTAVSKVLIEGVSIGIVIRLYSRIYG
jgi:hypothetical protein